MRLDTLTRPGKTKRARQRVGRGQSSRRGKTSGRGMKGQNARAGRKKRPELRDIIKKLPKRRGHGKNRGRTVNPRRPRPLAVTLVAVEKAFDAGATVNLASLKEKGLVSTPNSKTPIKLIGSAFTKRVTISGVLLSAGARAAIEKAGGTVTA